jgi:hypothetical protein
VQVYDIVELELFNLVPLVWRNNALLRFLFFGKRSTGHAVPSVLPGFCCFIFSPIGNTQDLEKTI